jgi:hypothetical protein
MYLKTNRRTLILLLSSVGLITLPHIHYVSGSTFTFFNLLLAWRVAAIRYPRCLPSKLILFFLTLLGLGLLLTQHPHVLGRDGGTSLFIIGLGLKLLEIHSERDLYLISYLAFVVASTLFLYDQSIVMLLYILAISVLLLATLMTLNSPLTTKTALKHSTMLILQALPLTLALFVLFPRVEAPRWMLFHNDSKAKTGLSDRLEPGSIKIGRAHV